MCGIVGFASVEGPVPARETRHIALEALRRRGPDGQGEWNENGVWFGHRRLAVMDLSSAGAQPMISHCGRFVIVFNGEIYNHREIRADISVRWRSQSDTETLLETLARFGTAGLERLNGMFAFALWDRRDRSLLLARDRIGEKPLYYTELRDGIAFASRPVALAALLGDDLGPIDGDGLRAYLELGYVPAPMTMYQRVRKLEAGTYLRWCEGRRIICRYWDFAHIPVDESLRSADERELVDEAATRVRMAVQRRLASDVALGGFLSAGVDSSLVVALTKSAGIERLRTFTIGFRETSHDESGDAAIIAAHLGTEHVTERLDVDDLLALMPEFLRDFDEPLADSSAFPTMAVARLARRSIVVALSGDGGDELFGGYHYYQQVQRLSPLLGLSPLQRSVLRRGIGMLPGHRARLLAAALTQSCDVSLHHFARSIGKDFPSLLHPDLRRTTTPSLEYFEQAAASFAPDLTPAERGMRLDLKFILADGYLQKVDLASMGCSLEVRCPLLDHSLIEWAMRLPLSLKVRAGIGKHILRRVLAAHLPRAIVHRPKTGFGVPLADWLRGPLRPWALELINDSSICARVPIDRGALRALMNLHLAGRRDAHPLLWAALVLLATAGRNGAHAGVVTDLCRAA
jgi:asparagine synthase (glutamine-hydrolysing)